MQKIATITGLVFGAALAVAAGVGVAVADTAPVTPDSLIETRQAGQDVVYGLVAEMKAAVAAKSDVKHFADSAGALSRWFHNFPSLFPAGTETAHNTKALPNVFTDAAGFAKAAQDASDAAAALSAAAKSGDAADFAAKFQALGGTCGACHKVYKQRT